MFFALLVIVYILILLLIVGKQTGLCFSKFGLPYGDGVRRQAPSTETRRIENAETDVYKNLRRCSVKGPFIFTPELGNATVNPNTTAYFQLVLKLDREGLFLLECDFQVTSQGSAALVGLYLDHVEYFNQVVDTSGSKCSDGPFLVKIKPNEVLTVSVRNRSSEPLIINNFGLRLHKKR
jgi:hypothetical protein